MIYRVPMVFSKNGALLVILSLKFQLCRSYEPQPPPASPQKLEEQVQVVLTVLQLNFSTTVEMAAAAVATSAAAVTTAAAARQDGSWAAAAVPLWHVAMCNKLYYT